MTEGILSTIRLVFTAIVSGADVAISRSGRKIGRYIHGLRMLAWITIAIPLLLVLAGAVFGWQWFTATAGLLWGLALLVLGVWATPLGIVVGAVWQKAKTSPATVPPTGFFLWRWISWWFHLPETVFRSVQDGAVRYIKFVRGVIFAELIITFILCVVPIRNNPLALPLTLLAGAIIWFAVVHWGFGGGVSKRIVYNAAIVTVVVLVISFFVPLLPRAVGKSILGGVQGFAESVNTNGLARALGGGRGVVMARMSLLEIPAPQSGEGKLRLPNLKMFVVVVTTNDWSGFMSLSPYTRGPMIYDSTNEFRIWYWEDRDDGGKIIEIRPDKTVDLSGKSGTFRIKAPEGTQIVMRDAGL